MPCDSKIVVDAILAHARRARRTQNASPALFRAPPNIGPEPRPTSRRSVVSRWPGKAPKGRRSGLPSSRESRRGGSNRMVAHIRPAMEAPHRDRRSLTQNPIAFRRVVGGKPQKTASVASQPRLGRWRVMTKVRSKICGGARKCSFLRAREGRRARPSLPLLHKPLQ